MSRKVLFSLLFVVLLGGAVYWGYTARARTQPDSSDEAASGPAPRVSVPNNRGAEVGDGFRGQVHPLLHRHTEMEVVAAWECKNDAYILGLAPEEVRVLFQNLRPAVPKKVWTERDFSGFLPAGSLTTVGQRWALDEDRVAGFLKQLHPGVSLRTTAVGKRAGPDGAFAVLRAISPSHLDIVFRVHAQFDLKPANIDLPDYEASYTPAFFLGRLVLNQREGTVEYFSMGVPTEDSMNVHITASAYDHDLIHVDRMELTGGNLETVGGLRWAAQIEMEQAHEQLAKVFYKFKEINWIAFDRTLATARAEKKPIFAVVLWGALDAQSC